MCFPFDFWQCLQFGRSFIFPEPWQKWLDHEQCGDKLIYIQKAAVALSASAFLLRLVLYLEKEQPTCWFSSAKCSRQFQATISWPRGHLHFKNQGAPFVNIRDRKVAHRNYKRTSTNPIFPHAVVKDMKYYPLAGGNPKDL